jgi:hypothetical protein
MSYNTQTMKTEIISALDVLPLESLVLLVEFVAFLRSKIVHSANQKPVVKPKFTLEQLLADVTENNIHSEVDTGDFVGNEVY